MPGFARFSDANGPFPVLVSSESGNSTSSAPPSSLFGFGPGLFASNMVKPASGSVFIGRSDATRPPEYINDSIFDGVSSPYMNDNNRRRSGAPSPATPPAPNQSGLPPFDPRTFSLNPSEPPRPRPGQRQLQTSEESVQRSPPTVSQPIRLPFDPSEFTTSPMAPSLAPRCIEKCGPPFEPTKYSEIEPYGSIRDKISIMSISVQTEYSRHSPEELRANYYEVGGKDMESTWVPVKTQSIKPFEFAANTASQFSKLGLMTPGGAPNTMAASSFGSVVGGMHCVNKAGFGNSLQEDNSVFGVAAEATETKGSPAQRVFKAGFEAGQQGALHEIKSYAVSSIHNVYKNSNSLADSPIVVALKEKLIEMEDDIRGQLFTDGLENVGAAKQEFTDNEVKELMDTHPIFMKEVDSKVVAEEGSIERGLLKRLAKANPNKTILEASRELVETGVNPGDFIDDYDGDREDNPGL